MKYTFLNFPTIGIIANSLEKIAKTNEKIYKQNQKSIKIQERLLKLQENYFKSEEERRNKNLSEKELRRLMQDPKYWKLQDPETVKRVEEGFKRLYGEEKK